VEFAPEPVTAATMSTLRAAGVGREAVAGVFLVGGSSRVPLVASLVGRAAISIGVLTGAGRLGDPVVWAIQ
jgi:molecular chaperone DnaK (HSP70)